MIKVLLVDDEPYIRKGLKIIIDWNKYGYEITGEAANGREAIKLLEKEKFDLIIADIKMPELNGIELLEYITAHKLSDAKFILLSGYYDFEYAKKAIRLNATDYIRKPVQKEELIQVLKELKVKFEEKENDAKQKEHTDRIVFDRHLISIIWGKYAESDIEYVEEFFVSTKNLRYINLELNSSSESFQALDEQDKRNVQMKVYDYLSELMGKYKYHVILDVNSDDKCYDVGLIYTNQFAEEQGLEEKNYMNHLINELKRNIQYKINIYVGQFVESLDQISISFQSAIVTKSYQTLQNNKDILYYEETLANRSNTYGVEKEKIDTLIHAAEVNDVPEIESCIDRIYHEFVKNNVSQQIINLNVDYLIYCLIHLAKELNPDANQDEVLQYISGSVFDFIAGRGNLTQFKKFVIEFSEYLCGLRQNTFRGILAYVEKDIKDNYMNNLSLKSLSEKYYINSAYLGQIFKKQYGDSFKDYLNNYRIEKASELLIRTDEKVYRISEMVGYNNLDYFINKFVSIKGKTPLQYRKQFVRRT